MERYTYKSLCFENIPPMVKPNKSPNSKHYSTLGIREPLENVNKYMLATMVEYVKNEKNGVLDGFIAGIAYLLDGSAIMVYTGSGENKTKVFSLHMTERECPGANSVAEYITEYIKFRNPEALLLIQEIEAVAQGEFHFRIVHDREEDRENNIIRFPQNTCKL